jgi:hypothetical protein
MRIRRIVIVVALAALAFVPAPARAQDTRKTGITMGFPESIGLIWESRTVALRPEITLSGASIDGGDGSSSTSWNIGIAVSALFYLHENDHLKTYVSPRVDFGHTHTSIDNAPGGNTSNNHWAAGGAGSFGAQYALGDHFAVYAEAGLQFSHTPTSSLSSTSANAWSTRTAIGGIFYP